MGKVPIEGAYNSLSYKVLQSRADYQSHLFYACITLWSPQVWWFDKQHVCWGILCTCNSSLDYIKNIKFNCNTVQIELRALNE